MNASGFYKRYGDELVFAANTVYAPDVTLLCEEKDQYNYPVAGWYWFDSEDVARAAFGMPPLPPPVE